MCGSRSWRVRCKAMLPCDAIAQSLFRLSSASWRRSWPAVKALCVRLRSVAHASAQLHCCANAKPIPPSSCGCGHGCCLVRRICASFLRLCLFLAAPNPRLHAAPWKGRWQWPAWLRRLRACLREYDRSPRAQIRLPACWVIYPRVCPVLLVPEFLFLASHPPLWSLMHLRKRRDCCL